MAIFEQGKPTMTHDAIDLGRRGWLGAAGAVGLGVAALASADRADALTSAIGRDATQAGVQPNSSADQTAALQRAIDDAAALRVPLALPPGVYRTGPLRLPDGAKIVGIRGATRLMFVGGNQPLLLTENTRDVTLSGLTLDGASLPVPQRGGLFYAKTTTNLLVEDCALTDVGGAAIWMEGTSGRITRTLFTTIGTTAVVSFNATGLAVADNTIIGTRSNGIEILRTALGDDGTIVSGNRIEKIVAGPGGSGQYGNAINAFRAANVIVSNNRIRDCDYSAVRGNSASNIHITGNSVSDVREVALYSEFAFEGAVIANNTVDGAALGVSVCNFMQGGRLCTVTGNLFRNLKDKRPQGTDPRDAAGVGIYIEADTAVTGNVVEAAASCGIMVGWGSYMRDVVVTGNVVRASPIGIGVTAAGNGLAVVANNIVSGATRGSIVGLAYSKPVTSDLTSPAAARLQQVALTGNVIRP